jgi:YD repeat-containing protein
MAGTRISKAGPVFRRPTSADFSPDRYLVARCPIRQSARTLRDKGEIVARLPRHRSRSKSGDAQPLNVAISDDGRLVASASCDGMVRVLDIEAHQMVGEGHVGGEITAITFDSAGQRIAAGRRDAQIVVFQVPAPR